MPLIDEIDNAWKKAARLVYPPIAHLEARGLEESLAAVLAPVCPLVVVLLSVKNRRVSVSKLSPTILALKHFSIY